MTEITSETINIKGTAERIYNFIGDFRNFEQPDAGTDFELEGN